MGLAACPACPDSGSENSGAQQYEGFVHDSSNQIRMGSLNCVARESRDCHCSVAVEIIQATFEMIRPCRCNAYRQHPIIKKYLEETTLDPLACSIKKILLSPGARRARRQFGTLCQDHSNSQAPALSLAGSRRNLNMMQ